MADITITEALAEIKTIGKRIEKKHEFVLNYLLRQEQFKDPLEREGGSVPTIQRELQAIRDLHERSVLIRRRINEANMTTRITINTIERSIADWLVWKRDVAPGLQKFYQSMDQKINMTRNQAMQKGMVLSSNVEGLKPTDVVVNIDERWLAQTREQLEAILGELDGLLSLKNATTMIII